MADDVKDSVAAMSELPPKAFPVPAESRAERARKSGYRNRFGLMYVVLAIAAGAGVGAFIVLLGRDGPAPAARWSSFEPSGSDDRRSRQIADRVSRDYRLPSGNQLVTAIAGPPGVTTSEGARLPVRAFVVRPDASRGLAEASDYEIVDANNSLMYVLCGLGDACSISEGEATPERLELLRREALELALYSFRYDGDLRSVIVLMPPRPDQQTATAVLLERPDVRDELSRPLRATLTSPVVPGIGQIPEGELRTINRITAPRLYTYEYTQAPDGSPLLVLSPALGA